MTDPADDRSGNRSDGPAREPGTVSRRALLFGGGALLGVAGTAGATVFAGGAQPPAPADTPAADGGTSSSGTAPMERIDAAGVHQAGIATPVGPQQHCIVAIGDVDLGALGPSLGELGAQVLALTSDGGDPAVTPDGPGDLTVTVGVGASALAAASGPAALQLAEFAGDRDLAPEQRGGDLFLTVNSSDPSVLDAVLARLTSTVAGWRPRWSQAGTRPRSAGGIARNPLGYHDGVIVPRGDELDANVWIADGPLAGGTVCVIRRFRLDAARFRALGQDARDAVIGRRQSDGAPLSGGQLHDEIDLRAKREDGELLVPAGAHARAAHPSFTGSDLMLRRSYGYRADENDHGLLFICHQRDIETFNRTQLRLDDTDALMGYATPTATAAFAILPGFGPGTPLGGTLF